MSKTEVSEGKRPYFRYVLHRTDLNFNFDLGQLRQNHNSNEISKKIREARNSGAIFTEGTGPESISSIRLFVGKGRGRKERKLNLTGKQGRFIYFLPFPNEDPLEVGQLLQKAGLQNNDLPEILDLLNLIREYGAIETI